MSHYIYVLYSLKNHALFKGYTCDLGVGFLGKNTSKALSSGIFKPLVLIYLEKFQQKKDALARQQFLQSFEGELKLRNFLVRQGIINPSGQLNLAFNRN